MELSGCIERAKHSEWASPLVAVPKSDGKFRITGDSKNTVNSQLCIAQYPLAIPDELFAIISGGETFSKLDGFDAYHQIEVEKSCKKYLVINTHRRLYRYSVLPKSIAYSPAIFQEFMDSLLKNIPMAGSYIDDGLCSGKSGQEHIKTVRILVH